MTQTVIIWLAIVAALILTLMFKAAETDKDDADDRPHLLDDVDESDLLYLPGDVYDEEFERIDDI